MREEDVTVSSSEQNRVPDSTVSNGKQDKKSRNIIIVLVVIIAVLGIAVAALAKSYFSKEEKQEVVTDGRATFVSKENVEEVKEELSKPVEDAYYTTSMTIDWDFYDGQSVSTNAYVKNSTANKRTVYFDVNLKATGELVYSSPYLPVGETMNEIMLDVDLDKGDYPAIITYHLVDDDHQEITTVSVAITLHILN